MKTKLLFILLVSSFTLVVAQWNQVGNSQFTGFTTNAAINFHPVNGNPYVIYDDLTDGNKAYVKRFDGTNWVAVGGAISSESSDNHAINFNPVTNEPWIAYRRTNNKMDVYSFDALFSMK